jgi:hypothetical protein
VLIQESRGAQGLEQILSAKESFQALRFFFNHFLITGLLDNDFAGS